MPTRAKQVCCQPGCDQLTDGRYCVAHTYDNKTKERRKEFDRNRTNDPLRAFYRTAHWTRTRAFVLARDPVCVACHVSAASIADHITRASVYVSSGGDFYDLANLQGLCKSCHDSKTAKECGWAGAKQ